ncbi:SUKH-3 domain-containing protein [Streptomyces sp. NPDC048172]|uniref:SUKH-3 domain-containing protein n=1 Tax=Streptomyces sp. NPDC048172 TaxID=3365505 RepID=UPI003713BD93
MGLEAPDDGTVAWMLGRLGLAWPTADEDPYREAADALRDLAGQAGGAAYRAYRGLHRAGVGAAFAPHWTATDADEVLPGLRDTAWLLAGALDAAAGAVESMKREIAGLLREAAASSESEAGDEAVRAAVRRAEDACGVLVSRIDSAVAEPTARLLRDGHPGVPLPAVLAALTGEDGTAPWPSRTVAPEDVDRWFARAGWFPGRDIGASRTRGTAATVVAEAAREGVVLEAHDRALAFLRTYGLLQLPGKNTRERVLLRPWPLSDGEAGAVCDLGDHVGERLFPVGFTTDPGGHENGTVALGERGSFYFLHWSGEYAMGATGRDAFANLLGNTLSDL